MGLNKLSKIKKWIKSKMGKPIAEKYEKIKREFEMAIGKPFITLKIEIPEGFKRFRREFLRLENDKQFQEEIKDLIKKRLILEERYGKEDT